MGSGLSIRGGYAYAQGAWLHGHLSEHYCVKESIRIWFWGLLLPLLTLMTIWQTKALSLVLLLTAYILLFCRIYLSTKEGDLPLKTDCSMLYFVLRVSFLNYSDK